MEVKYMSLKKQYSVWTTDMPQILTPISSPSFLLNGCNWFFEFFRTSDGQMENKILHLRLCRNGENSSTKHKLLMSTLAKNSKGGYDSISCERVIAESKTTTRHKVMSIVESDLTTISSSTTRVTFMFIFDFGILDFSDGLKNIVKEHKSVQTVANLDDRTGSLLYDLYKSMDENSNSDLQVKCGEKIFHGHRFIFCARSEVFRAMLQSDMLEKQNGLITISDIEPNVFQFFLRYLYTDTLPDLTLDIALPLYEAGDKYHLEGLKRYCRNFLAENLTPNNAYEILVIADAHNDKDLKERTISYLSRKEIPTVEEDWFRFNKEHMSLANEVLYRTVKRLKTSK